MLLCPRIRRKGKKSANDRYRAARSDEGIPFSLDMRASPGKGDDSKGGGKGSPRGRVRRPTTAEDDELSRTVNAMLQDADEVQESVRLRKLAADTPAPANAGAARKDGRVEGTLLVAGVESDVDPHSTMSLAEAGV
eukprot:4848464-Prymnesium_polylepis.1